MTAAFHYARQQQSGTIVSGMTGRRLRLLCIMQRRAVWLVNFGRDGRDLHGYVYAGTGGRIRAGQGRETVFRHWHACVWGRSLDTR